MDEKAKAARREYLRAWRAANKDRVKVYNAEYCMRKANETSRVSAKQQTGGINRDTFRERSQ